MAIPKDSSQRARLDRIRRPFLHRLVRKELQGGFCEWSYVCECDGYGARPFRDDCSTSSARAVLLIRGKLGAFAVHPSMMVSAGQMSAVGVWTSLASCL